MGQKTHPVQLRTTQALQSCWYSRSQYADLLHYEVALRKGISRRFQKRLSAGPIYTSWNGRGLSMTLTSLPIEKVQGWTQPEKHTSKPSLNMEQRKAKEVKTHQLYSLLRKQAAEIGRSQKTSLYDHKSLQLVEDVRNDVHKNLQTHADKRREFWKTFLLSNRVQGWWGRRVQACALESSYQSAQTIAQLAATRIESGVKTRTVLDTLLRESQSSQFVQGINIRVAGRLQGAEIASAQTKQWGLLGLHTFSQRVDYACTQAHISAGIIGIQVWVSFRRKEKKETAEM